MSQITNCHNCGKAFRIRHIANPNLYCSRQCHYDARRGLKRVEHPPIICPTCGKAFERKNWQDSVYCSVPCSRLGIRKHQREDVTQCAICGKNLTKRQISNRSKYCSRQCHSEGLKVWHAVPANKDAKRTHALKAVAKMQQGRTSIEIAIASALDAAGLAYVEQFPIGNSHGTIFICDFAFPDAMLIVEADGDYWHSLPSVVRKDEHKDKYLHACGYTVLRFSESQIKQDVFACVHVIKSHLAR